MQKLVKMVSLAVVLASFTTSAVAPFKEWTFLVYMAGANGLSGHVAPDLREMGFASPSPSGNVVAFVNDIVPVAGVPQPRTQRFFQSGTAMVQDPAYPTLIGSSAYDSGAPSTLVTAAQWALDNYPSNNFVLIIWNHGDILNRSADKIVADLAFGDLTFHENLSQANLSHANSARGVCYNQFTGNYFTDASLASALSQISAYRGSNIDILAFDACFMSSIEIAYAVAPYANYMVASQNSVPGSGFAYATMLSVTNNDPAIAGAQMIDAYNTFYNGLSTQYTLALMDLGNLAPLINNANAVSTALISALQSSSKKAVQAAICTAFNNTMAFDVNFFIDMSSFYREMRTALSTVSYANQTVVDALLLAGEGLLEVGGPINLSNVNGSLYTDACGMSVYFNPARLNPVANPTSYSSMLFATNNLWSNFLSAFLAAGVCA